MVGYCHLRQSMRTFKVDRVRSAEALMTTFTRDKDFDLAAYLSEGWGLMRGLDLPVEQVELRFRAPAARWVAEESWHVTQDVEWLSDNVLRFRVSIQVTPEFQRWVFRYGRDVDVIEPESLRRWVRAEAEAMLATAAVGAG
jgi:predicted DNA-binding transcriptional regulator YafY